MLKNICTNKKEVNLYQLNHCENKVSYSGDKVEY